jgi:hypothetical protein
MSGPRLLLGWSLTQVVCMEGPSHLFQLRDSALRFVKNCPFGIFSHVFVFLSYKTIISKYMWNLVNSKCICA